MTRYQKARGNLWIIVLLMVFTVCAMAQEIEPQEKKIVTFGNSLTMTIGLDKLIDLAETRGHDLHWERVGIAGTPLDYLWDNRADQCKALLAKGGWDIMSLQPFLRPLSSDLPAVENYIHAAMKHNPDIVTYIYAQYIHDGGFDYQDIWLQDVSEYVEKDAGAGLYKPERTREYYEALTLKAREKMPERKIYMAPVGHAFALFDEKIKAGQVSGVDSVFQMWGDGTHVNNFGGYLTGMVYYAMIFKENPAGLGVGDYQGSFGQWQITDEQARIMQETAWEVVASHPLTGVNAKGEAVKIVTPGIHRKAIQGEPYRKEFTRAFGKHPFMWSLVGGQLPDGLKLEPDGIITGTPAETGHFKLQVELTDASGATDRAFFTIESEADVAPEIVTAETDLGTYSAGETIKIQLAAKGGNGKLKWTVEVPEGFDKMQDFGLELRADGFMSGSVGKPGTYALKAKVRDNDISDPEVLEKTYQVTITEPEGTVLKVPALANDTIKPWHQLRRDGHEDYWGVFWKQFEDLERHPLTRVVKGDSDNKAWFQIYRSGTGLNIIVTVHDDDIFVNDENLSEGDSVEVYVDILNNREKIYNADDRRFIFAPDGQKTGSTGIRYTSVRKIADGYWQVHVGMSSHKMKRAMKPYVVLGLDIAVNDKDSADGAVSTIMWHGDTLHEVDTSNFGTIIMMPDQE